MKITPPEGYEIDKENSTFECIKFKPIKKDLTYKDIRDKLGRDARYIITSDGDIERIDKSGKNIGSNSVADPKQLRKIIAINQLMNIAKYYNGGWKPDWKNSYERKFYIEYYKGRYNIEVVYSINHGIVYFRSRDDVQAVIDNPNFQDILDAIFK